MADRTTISVSEETKALLDEQRGSVPWNQFLQDLATEGDDRVMIHPDSVAEIADLAASRSADELESRLR